MTKRLDEIKARLEAATKRPLALGNYEAGKEAEHFAENLSHGTGACWLVWCPEHPATRIGSDPLHPEHATTMCVTGNGPTSKANAEFIANAPADLAYLLARVEELGQALLAINRSGAPGGSIVAKRGDGHACQWCRGMITPCPVVTARAALEEEE